MSRIVSTVMVLVFIAVMTSGSLKISLDLVSQAIALRLENPISSVLNKVFNNN